MKATGYGRDAVTMWKRFNVGRWMGLGCVACITVCCAVLSTGCAELGGKEDAAKLAGIKYLKPLTPQALDRLPLSDRIRYFTDNVYLANEQRGEARDIRATAAAAALDHLRETLDKKAFVSFWIGVDPEFFGRVNAVLPYTDYTHPQMAVNQRVSRTAYNLQARHLAILGNLAETRKIAMQDLIDLAEKGDSAACFAFHKSYKDYRDPLNGAPGVTWLDVDGKPFRKSSMWAGSAEASHGGRVVQIAVPPQAVLGCRRLVRPTSQVTAGVVEEVEQFFSAINLNRQFNPETFAQHKDAWLQALRDKAATGARQVRLSRIRVINVVDVYRIFPPALDYEYEMAVADGTLSEMVATGMLSEEQAFVVEERIRERRILLTGVGATPQQTPMAFLKLVADRPKTNK